jgi:hypothetical protein
MDIADAINAARKAGFVATEQTFLERFPANQWQGILLKPGQVVLSREAFIEFVQKGCKDAARYARGTGFQSVLDKHIDDRLAELYAAQKPFVEPASPDVAESRPWSPEEMEGYAQRKVEIDYLEKERIKIQEFLDSLTPKRS